MEKEDLLDNTIERLDDEEKKLALSVASYTDLPDLILSPLMEGDPITINHDIEHELYCGKIIATYPWINGRQEGGPIKDVLLMHIWKNRIIAAIADGQGHGKRPYEAACCAVAKLKDYLVARQQIMNDIPETGRLLLRAFSEGNKHIIEGKEEIWDAGSTTLLGAILAEMPGSWGLTVANVGNCKAYVYSKSADAVREVTAANVHFDDHRAGGRLGPYLEFGLPDLCNLRLYFTQCCSGDMVILLSDGVWRNLDPEIMGLNPPNCGEEPQEWVNMSREISQRVKTRFCEMMIHNMIQQGHNTPTLLTRELIRHCRNLTQPMRQFMQDNADSRPPNDYKTHPGWMDDSTVVVFSVPAHSNNTNN